MRTVDTTTYTGTVVFPDEFIFAFNPNYIDVNVSGLTNDVTIQVASSTKSYEISMSPYNGNVKAYISRLIQLLFTDSLNTRSIPVTMTVIVGSATIATETGVALWSGLQIGEQFGKYGFYKMDLQGKGLDHIRKVTWFVHFPFKISMFRGEDSGDIHVIANGETKTKASTQVGIFDLNPADDLSGVEDEIEYSIKLVEETMTTFTTVFDYTFTGSYNNVRERVLLHKDESKDGLYIRWVDQYGFLQYYLFVKGDITNKTKLDSTEIDDEQSYNGMYFGNLTRVKQVTNSTSIKCSAVNLDKLTMAYVETVILSPYVDLYLGKDKNAQEIWLPIKVSAGSYKINKKGILKDYEITIELPDTITQTL